MGIYFNVYGGNTHKEFIIETTGNGVVIFDYDNDGWPDIFLPNGSTVEEFPKDTAPTSHLFHNNHDGLLPMSHRGQVWRLPAGHKEGASATTTMTAISICWSLIGDRMCFITTTGMARLPMRPPKPGSRPRETRGLGHRDLNDGKFA
jgi:hypothetical protein